MRSKSELQELLDIYDKAMSGDAAALIKLSKIVFKAELSGGANNGKDKQRKNRRKKNSD